MRLDAFVIAISLAFLVLMGGVMIVDEQIDVYNINVTNKAFEGVSTQVDEINEQFDTMRGNVEPGEISIVDTLNILISGAFNAITNIWQFFAITKIILTEIATLMGIEPFILNIFITIIGISILFAVIYMIFRFQPR